MNGSVSYKSFDAATVHLNGSNLIEASAGTGKTYSIAILLLRLILEKNLAVRDILMVTFTRAAVAELEERIRHFVRSARLASQGKPIGDKNIYNLVQQAIDKLGISTVQQKLNDAVLLLDETSVLTIHSFCQQILNEFAFETNQLFGTEMVPDIKSIIEEELNKSWRKNITTMPVALLGVIWSDKMKDALRVAIEEHLSGKKYFGYDESADYEMSNGRHDEWITLVESSLKKESSMREALSQYLKENKEQILKSTANSHAKRHVLPLIDSPKEFLDYIWQKRGSAYIPTSFPDLLQQLEGCDDCSKEYRQLIQSIISHLYFQVIRDVSDGVEIYKLRNNLLSYDDMIINLHKAIVGRDNPALVNALRQKYKAVFVDEFQDTDRQQFEIFDRAFSTDTILFYIGDPKQSIYSWRKADIFTYFKARHSVQHVYGMNKNYRSSASFIQAMNRFFLPLPDFDTFYFKNDREAIQYNHVESPGENDKGNFVRSGQPDKPITIFKADNQTALADALAAQVSELLHDENYGIKTKTSTQKIRPADIGILVRTSVQGRIVKEALANAGIAAVTIDDSKVLQSNEAVHMSYLLSAIESPGRSSINRALLSPFTGFNTKTILLLDDEVTLRLFNGYRTRWHEDGIYSAFLEFVTDFGITKSLLHDSVQEGDRIVTNTFQLVELLHQMQSRKNLSMTELISWLKRGINGMVTEGDEYFQRIESDEEAVKIVTIHKSKGLEYNLVFAPFLDFVPKTNIDFFSFRSPESGGYFGMESSRADEEQKIWYSEQAEQENRRLLYVAITRAVYKCYIFKNNYFKSSTLTTFLNALPTDISELIFFEQTLPVLKSYAPLKTEASQQEPAARVVHFQLVAPNWRKMSYTMLAAKVESGTKMRAQKTEDPYQTFIMHTLRRGAQTGNLLHYIFENINFADDSYWDRTLEEAIRQYVPGRGGLYKPMLKILLTQVFTTEIQISNQKFSLAEVDYYKRIPEFEFDFPVPEFFPDLLNDLSDEAMTIIVKGFQNKSTVQLEGIMNGKMDLFFEHQGRYYILDWKSNYLGPSPDDYSTKSIAIAMNENNYHLQYLIYTVAAKKYLESRLPQFNYETQFGGVIYLFVRGMRYGTTAGIYVSKPSGQKIDMIAHQILKT